LFGILRDHDQPDSARFRAGMALGEFAPHDKSWNSTDFSFLTRQMLEASRDDQRDVRDYLRPLKDQLLRPLDLAFHDAKERMSIRLAAADALADLASDDVPGLAILASDAMPEQYAPLMAALLEKETTDEMRATLIQLMQLEPPREVKIAERTTLDRRRAGAAITLLRLGFVSDALPVLRVNGDPEAATRFIHGLRDRGVPVQTISDAIGGESSNGVLYGLLLALGEYQPNDLSPQAFSELRRHVVNWYANDPRSAIHGAAGWLLRHWGMRAEAERVDHTTLPWDAAKMSEWFVEKVGEDYFTFIVFMPGEFMMGSDTGEPFHRANEARHRVQITRP
ncbi:MAG: hypothetical protein ACRD36_14185, partial [Candidatus Acidiferrum sp.]